MDEKAARMALLALALGSIGITLAVYFTYIPVFQSVAPSVLTPIVCAHINGTYAYSQSTSSDFCSSLSSSTRNLNVQVCDAYPARQQSACRQLFDALNKRESDCLAYFFTNQTKYAAGLPAVSQACDQLK